MEQSSIIDGHGLITIQKTHIEAPKTKEFRGERSTQDIDNFLWKMDAYFEHVNMVDEAAKIRMATIYLHNTTMLWWHKKKVDMDKDTCSIDDWK